MIIKTLKNAAHSFSYSQAIAHQHIKESAHFLAVSHASAHLHINLSAHKKLAH